MPTPKKTKKLSPQKQLKLVQQQLDIANKNAADARVAFQQQMDARIKAFNDERQALIQRYQRDQEEREQIFQNHYSEKDRQIAEWRCDHSQLSEKFQAKVTEVGELKKEVVALRNETFQLARGAGKAEGLVTSMEKFLDFLKVQAKVSAPVCGKGTVADDQPPASLAEFLAGR